MNALSAVHRASSLTDAVIVGVSGGKDSLAVLDLCRTHFKRVEGYFLYLVSGLEFQERYLCYLERRYAMRIHRLPHWVLSRMFRNAAYRPSTDVTLGCPRVDLNDVLDEVRSRTGLAWVATGEKVCDSLERRAMLSRCGGVDEAAGRCFPIAAWSNAAVYSFLRLRRVPLPPDYRLFGRSFGSFNALALRAVRDHYPRDWGRVLEVFPYLGAVIARDDFRQARQG